MDLVLDSLGRRMRAMHSLYEQATSTMDVGHVNHVERPGVLPIAFSLFHAVHIEDGAALLLGAGAPVWSDDWAARLELGVVDHGKNRTVEEMMAQRIGNWDAYRDYQATVFARTEEWLARFDPTTLDEIVVARPLPETLASTFSARVAGPAGITRLDGVECWIYQHGLRHLGEIEHARALVGLGGMTSYSVCPIWTHRFALTN